MRKHDIVFADVRQVFTSQHPMPDPKLSKLRDILTADDLDVPAQCFVHDLSNQEAVKAVDVCIR